MVNVWFYFSSFFFTSELLHHWQHTSPAEQFVPLRLPLNIVTMR